MTISKLPVNFNNQAHLSECYNNNLWLTDKTGSTSKKFWSNILCTHTFANSTWHDGLLTLAQDASSLFHTWKSHLEIGKFLRVAWAIVDKSACRTTDSFNFKHAKFRNALKAYSSLCFRLREKDPSSELVPTWIFGFAKNTVPSVSLW
mgnify:CR=1 FL=1